MINRAIIYILISLSLTSCATVEDSVFSPLYFGPDNISIRDAKLKVRKFVRDNPNNWSASRMACDSLGIYSPNSRPTNYPLQACERDAQEYYKEIRAEIKAKAEAEKKEELKKQQDEIAKKQRQAELNKAAEEADKKRKAEELKTAIKSGLKQPSSVEEFEILYDAKNGAFLSSSPKIKPDNKYYSILGAINYMESDNVIVAQLLTENRYFKVRIPENIKQDFENTAKVKGWFGFVGKYTENSDVLLVLFQSVQVPVFDAVYFKAVNFDDKK